MAQHKTLIAYIKKHLEKGVDITKIKKALSRAGHPINRIELAVEGVFESNPHLRKKKKFDANKYFKKFQSRQVIGIGIGVLAVVLILFLVMFGLKQFGEYSEYREDVVEFNENQTFELMSDLDLLNFAQQEGDMKACSFIESHNYYYACVEKWWEKDDCKFLLLTDQPTDECRYNYAIKEKNILLCVYIQDLDLRTKCYSFETDFLRDKLDLALAVNNISLCNQDKICEYEYYLTKERCDLMLDSGDSNNCFIELAKIKGDQSFCDKLNNSNNLDIDLSCDFLFYSEEQIINSCQYLADRGRGLEGTEEEFVENIAFSECLMNSAISRNMPNLCFKTSFNEACLTAVTKFAEHGDSCGLIQDTAWNSVCTAIKTQNSELCNIATETNLNTLCNIHTDMTKNDCEALPIGALKQFCERLLKLR
ncbi:hypothetical protein HN587_06390 [Candidatus Woesearchaeota archaeon]|jgi:hypothetical protein|nr:hypothetical protein [Candidatus Woesearchaeota archaeon]